MTEGTIIMLAHITVTTASVLLSLVCDTFLTLSDLSTNECLDIAYVASVKIQP